ncbi:flagellar hook-basal body protein [Paludibacterium paludis]|uniref:Flagellar basal-body rod protein FlgF n=1 Tax=Paludibacterium paludis TaxID=1225769 RepID=A0A918UC78_9NEIS|nr:flagellar hook basal-body protein [Paludibacterium paludis]GGY28784.1 flagellar basal-body rod protein FlgF [Paludibacterium paludis]
MNALMGVLASSMNADMARLGGVAHNMANATTPGYKKVFALPPEVTRGGTVDRRSGVLSRTGDEFHLAIDGDGFFVAGGDGEPMVTRGGAMKLDSRGRLLFAQSGRPVRGEGGDIFLAPGAFTVTAAGEVTQGGVPVARLRLVSTKGRTALDAMGEGLYRMSGVDSAEPAGGHVRQGYLEMSNVNSAREMVELMEATRHFESVQRAVTGLDAVWEKSLKTLGEF